LKKELEGKNFKFENEINSAWEQFWKQSRFECFPKCLNNGSWDCTGALQVGESMP
jgi:hypothetical protein